MKIIEALKKTKDLLKKAEDLRSKIAQYHVDYEHESPTYGTPEQQRDQVNSWLQAHSDILKELCTLRARIQKTNVLTKVKITLGGKVVERTIAEWIHRRKDLAGLEMRAWDLLNDKGMAETGKVKRTDGSLLDTKIRRYYDPSLRDKKREEFRSEPSEIDGTLEVVNAITDLLPE